MYWSAGGSVGAANNDGSMPIDTYPYEFGNASDGADVVAVAVNDTHLYWGDLANRAIGSMTLSGTPDGRIGFGDGGVGVTQNLVPDVDRPWGVAVDDSHLYWASTAGAIGRANLDGTAVDRSFIDGLDSPCGIAVHGAYLYWGEIGPETIGRARLDGTDVDPDFIVGATSPCGLAVDAAHIYWTSGGSIGRADVDGGDLNPTFVTGIGSPCGVAVDGDHLYWGNYVERGIYVGRANLDGSGAAPLIGSPNEAGTCGVALDSRVFQMRPARPSSPIRFGSVKRRKKGRLVIVPLYVAARGELTLTSPRIGWRLNKGPEPPPWVAGSFRWTLKLWPGPGRVGKRIRRQLRNGKKAPIGLAFDWQELGKSSIAGGKKLAFFPPKRPT